MLVKYYSIYYIVNGGPRPLSRLHASVTSAYIFNPSLMVKLSQMKLFGVMIFREELIRAKRTRMGEPTALHLVTT